MGSLQQGSDERAELAQLCQVPLEAIEDSYACYPIQEALMAASTETSNSYVLQMVCRLDDGVDLDDWQQAWQETALANAILRTRIVRAHHSAAVQVVIREPLVWTTSDSLKSYLSRDINLPISFGDRLWRFGIVTTTGPVSQERFFIWTAHHAVCDGFSLPELLRGVGLRFKKLPPPPAPPYKNFIDYLHGVDQTKAEKFWRRELAGSSSIPFPPTQETSRRALPSSVLSRDVRVRWPESLKVSKALILQAAWAVLLSKYTGSTDVVFPTVSSGRTTPIPDIRHVTGPVFTVVPVSFKVIDTQTIGQFFMSAYMRYKEMLQYEQSGLSNIRRYLGEEEARVCDFQNILVIQPGTFTDLATDVFKYLGMNILKEHWKYETHTYPLVSTLTYAVDGFHLRFEYDPSILHEVQVSNLANQYEEIVNRFCTTDPRKPLGVISALSAADRAQIFTWNAPIPASEETCLHQLVSKQALKFPTVLAIMTMDGGLSYSELEKVSSALALQLVDSGVGVGSGAAVAVCFEKSRWAIVAMLAILKAGAAYVPLDPSHPKERLQEILTIAEIKYAVTSPVNKSLLEGICEHIISFNGELSPRSSEVKLPDKVVSSSPAYILFTSGSSGKPKGVVVQHSAICTSIIAHGNALGFDPYWRTLQFSSYTFDVSIAEIFTTLAFGGCVCIPSDHQRMNDLSGAIYDLDVNAALLTPTVASLLLPEEVPSLRKLILGGEAATAEQVNRWRGHVRVANGFGPTEASVYCAVNPDMFSSGAANIGTSVGGTNWVVDPQDHELLVPIGCVGELLISGLAIAQGYLGNAVETDGVFVSAPRWLAKAGHPSTKVYKTGDLVKYKHDGTMEFIGRKDTQVKIRGLRIELGEIEHRLSEASEAKTVVALAPKSGLCRDKLVAVMCLDDRLHSGDVSSAIKLDPKFVSHALDTQIAAAAAYLASKVPDYMVPTVWVVLPRSPVLSSGKLARKAILSWVDEMDAENYRICSRGFDSAPQNGTTDFVSGSLISDLRNAWSQVLNVPLGDIGPGTTFFSLGGDSISAIQIVTKCRKLGIMVMVKDILLSRSLSKLHLLATRTTHSSVAEVAISDEPFELSPIQRMFFAQNTGSAKSLRYNHGVVLKLRRDMSANAVKSAFDAVVRRHPMLRARFVQKDNRWMQFYAQTGQDSYRFKIHSSLQDEEIDTIVEDGHAAIDITNGPVFSVDIFDSARGRMVFIVAHHLVVDLVSWRVVLQDVEDYLLDGSMPTPLGVSFSSWSRALQERFDGDSSLTGNYPGLSVTSGLDVWGVSPAENTYGNAGKISWKLESEATSLLLGQANSTSRTDTVELLVSAIAVAFQRTFIDSFTPTVFVEGHGRESWSADLDISSTVGWFTIMHPISNFPAPDKGLKALLQHTRRARRAYSDHGLEYFSRTYLSSEDKSSEAPREILLNYQGLYQQLENETSLFELVDDFQHAPVSADVHRNALFEIEARIHNNCLEVSFAYNKTSNHQAQIQEWGQEIKTTLLEICRTLPTDQSVSVQSIGDFVALETPEVELLDALLQAKISGSKAQIEDVYSCSEIQAHMLRTQLRDPSLFHVSWDIELSSQTGKSITLVDLERAWKAVVRKYPILRTVFLLDATIPEVWPVQVVLDEPEPSIFVELNTQGDGQGKMTAANRVLPHQLTLCTTVSGAVRCRFEATHAVLDGFSIRLLMSEFVSAYQGKLSVSPSPSSSTFSSSSSSPSIYTRSKKQGEDINHHNTPQHTNPPCLLLPLNTPSIKPPSPSPENRFTTLLLPTLSTTDLQSTCTKNNITLSSLLAAAWARTLSSLTCKRTVAFGTVVSTRTSEADQVVVGPMVRVVGCVVADANAGGDGRVVGVAREVMGFGVGFGSEVYGSSEERGYNTAFNYQKMDGFGEGEGEGEGEGDQKRAVGDLILTQGAFTDPWDYDVFVRIFAGPTNIDVRLEFDSLFFGEEDRKRVGVCFEEVLRGLEGLEGLGKLGSV